MTDNDLKRLWKEADEALYPTNARAFDGDNNYTKSLVITTCVVGGDKGEPAFVLNAKSPRSAVNNLEMSSNWSTNSRTEAAACLRKLAAKIEEGT